MKTRECKSLRMCIALMLTNYFATCYTLFVNVECFIHHPAVWIKVWHTCSSSLEWKCKLMEKERWNLRGEKTFVCGFINNSLAPKKNLIANLINAFTSWTAASRVWMNENNSPNAFHQHHSPYSCGLLWNTLWYLQNNKSASWERKQSLIIVVVFVDD